MNAEDTAPTEVLVIDSGPLLMQATTDPGEQQQEVHDVGDRPGAGE